MKKSVDYHVSHDTNHSLIFRDIIYRNLQFGWGNEDTTRILDTLKAHNIKVTFFMTGGWVDSYPDDVKAILAAGHDLGNHSENHKNMSQLSDEECQKEIMDVHNKIKTLTGYEMTLFRPPFGDYDNHVITNAAECGYFTIQWNCDTLDT